MSIITHVICSDGRPDHQYGALRAHLGQVADGWLPLPEDRGVNADGIDLLMQEAGAYWSEYGDICVDLPEGRPA